MAHARSDEISAKSCTDRLALKLPGVTTAFRDPITQKVHSRDALKMDFDGVHGE
jgi:hypothetical protein